MNSDIIIYGKSQSIQSVKDAVFKRRPCVCTHGIRVSEAWEKRQQPPRYSGGGDSRRLSLPHDQHMQSVNLERQFPQSRGDFVLLQMLIVRRACANLGSGSAERCHTRLWRSHTAEGRCVGRWWWRPRRRWWAGPSWTVVFDHDVCSLR